LEHLHGERGDVYQRNASPVQGNDGVVKKALEEDA
jgi:hypothetical protein